MSINAPKRMPSKEEFEEWNKVPPPPPPPPAEYQCTSECRKCKSW